jgi:hypothetical protein
VVEDETANEVETPAESTFVKEAVQSEEVETTIVPAVDGLDTTVDDASTLPELTEDEANGKEAEDIADKVDTPEEEKFNNDAMSFMLENSDTPFAFIDAAQPVTEEEEEEENDEGDSKSNEEKDSLLNEKECESGETSQVAARRRHRARLSFIRTNSGTLRCALAPAPALIRVHTEPAYKVRVHRKASASTTSVPLNRGSNNSDGTSTAAKRTSASLNDVLDALREDATTTKTPAADGDQDDPSAFSSPLVSPADEWESGRMLRALTARV